MNNTAEEDIWDDASSRAAGRRSTWVSVGTHLSVDAHLEVDATVTVEAEHDSAFAGTASVVSSTV